VEDVLGYAGKDDILKNMFSEIKNGRNVPPMAKCRYLPI
jgi:hypothetical protein